MDHNCASSKGGLLQPCMDQIFLNHFHAHHSEKLWVQKTNSQPTVYVQLIGKQLVILNHYILF